MYLSFRTPTKNEFRQIISYLREYELDDRNLQAEQFTAAFADDVLAGFGRLRQHTDCLELCSLGVVKAYRLKTIGHQLVQQLIRRARQDIYLVCIIPEFFTPLDFEITGTYPQSMAAKLSYCVSELSVPETYVVMKRQGSP